MTPQQFIEQVASALGSQTYPDYIKKTAKDIALEVTEFATVVVGAEYSDARATSGQSKIGGQPDLPEDILWPHEDEENSEGPLAFLCQINLAEVQEHDLAHLLPTEGMLWFFSIADGDRAYGYEIDDDTTKVIYQAKPNDLSTREIPEELADDEDAEIEERCLVFGPSLLLLEAGEEGRLERKRYDGSIERALDAAVSSLGGRSGAVRMLGIADFFREENQEISDPAREIVLVEIDGYSVANNAFGEGGFTWSIDKTPLAEGKLDCASLIFEVGT